MARKSTNGQQKLTGTAVRRKVGATERYAGTDVRRLRELELVPPGMEALEKVYRDLGRTFDEALADDDRYGRINTAREMLRVRQALAPMVADAGGLTIEDMLAELNA